MGLFRSDAFTSYPAQGIELLGWLLLDAGLSRNMKRGIDDGEVDLYTSIIPEVKLKVGRG